MRSDLLGDAEAFLQAGDHRRARNTLERARSRALIRQDAEELAGVVTLAQALAIRDPSARSERLLQTASQNLNYLRRVRGGSYAAASRTVSRAEFRRQLDAVDAA